MAVPGWLDHGSNEPPASTLARLVLLAYVDESYTKDRYWIVGLVCPDPTIGPLSSALDELMKRAVASYGGSWDSELHGYDLFHGEANWLHLKKLHRARIGIYGDALTAIAAHPVDVFIRGVNSRGLRARYAKPWHPHAVVMGHLLERIDERAAKTGDNVLIIADEVDEAATYRRDLWEFQRAATPGYRARQLTQIIDTIHFAPSQASRLLQAVDLIAFLYQRIQRGEVDDRAKRANDELWRRIEPRVAHIWCWDP
jgi:hypothetical protein